MDTELQNSRKQKLVAGVRVETNSDFKTASERFYPKGSTGKITASLVNGRGFRTVRMDEPKGDIYISSRELNPV